MGEPRFGAELDDIVYGAYVRERDIMEIPASGRLFMGHRHVARIAGERSVSLSFSSWYTGRMTIPQGQLLQDDPSPSSNAVMASHGDLQRGGIAILWQQV